MFKVVEAYRDLKRSGQIAAVFMRYGFGELLDRVKAGHYVPWRRRLKSEAETLKRLSAPERLRLAFEELGPTFVKLGQVLSTRADVLPPAFIAELSKLQDRAAPFPFAAAKSMIEGQLKRTLSEAFLSIDDHPAAAASLSQVHKAITMTGDVVAVKVQRPDIEAVVEADIRILYDLAGLAEKHLAESVRYRPTRLVDEFAGAIRRELDFVREGRNINRFRRYFAGSPTVYIPEVHWDLTTPRVLTTEYIRGIKVSDLERLEAAGLDRKTIAGNGADLILKEVFDFHFFHADPHPGNLFVLAGNVIAPIDFGMTGVLTEETAEQLGEVFVAVVRQDVGALATLLKLLGWLPESSDDNALKLDLQELLERYHGLPLKQLSLGAVLEELTDIIRRYDIRVPAELMLMTRALLVSEGVGRMVYPEFNIIEFAKPYAAKLIARRYDPARQINALFRTGGEAAALLTRLPSELGQLLSKAVKGELAVRFMHGGLESFVTELEKSTNRLSFAVVIAALIIGSSLIFRSGLGPTFFGYPVLGLFGFLLVSILGIWLLVGILRSGRL